MYSNKLLDDNIITLEPFKFIKVNATLRKWKE